MRTSAKRSRVTQAERSDAMRARLLRATVDVILEEGWAEASTLKICARAGVSRGAQTHHYPTKAELLMAAVKEMVRPYQAEIDEELALKEKSNWSLDRLFRLLWDACLEDGLMESWIAVMVAARTDAELRAAVAEMDKTSLATMREAGRATAAGKSKSENLAADIVELTVYLLRGMVVQRGVHPEERERKRLYRLWLSIVTDRLDLR